MVYFAKNMSFINVILFWYPNHFILHPYIYWLLSSLMAFMAFKPARVSFLNSFPYDSSNSLKNFPHLGRTPTLQDLQFHGTTGKTPGPEVAK